MNRTPIGLALLLTGSMAFSQAPAPAPALAPVPAPALAAAKAPTAGQVLDRQLANLEREFVPAAEAMPEEKFHFAPTNGEFKGVKTFALQVRHVAAANYSFAASFLGEKPPVDTGGDDGPEALKTKAEIVKFLKDSFAYAHRAFGTITNENITGAIPTPWGQGTISRLGLANLTVAHGFDHYGQMAVYLRMNGIIPPASRKP